MNKVFDIMVAGHLCLDIIPKFYDTGARKIEQIMCPGKLVNITEAKISTGGPVSNTGINMKTLGANVCFCARVGDDEFGKITIDLLRQNGNADGVKSIANTVSSYTIVIAPAGIDRIFLHNPGTNDTFAPEDLDIEMIAKCTHFHFGYPPLMHNIYIDDGRKLTEVFKIAKLAGATTSCDMTLPDPKSESGKVNWRKVLQNTLPYIDIFLPSVEETFYMLHPQDFLNMKAEHNNAELIDFFKPGDYTNIANEILSMGAKIVSLKSGHRGFYIKTSSKDKFDTFGAGRPADFYNWSNRELWAPAFLVENFGSATGSGDSSIAGLLTAYLNGLTIEESLKYATCAGYQNVCVLDAVSGIRGWNKTTEMIASDMSMLDTNIKGNGWKYDDGLKLFIGTEDRK